VRLISSPLQDGIKLLPGVENFVLDLKKKENCYQALNGYEEVFNLAAEYGRHGIYRNT